MANILIVSGNLKKWEKISGGVERTATLAEAFPNDDVTFFCFAWDTEPEEFQITDRLRYVRASVDSVAVRKYRAFIKNGAKNNYDITVQLVKPHLQNVISSMKKAAKGVDLIIIDHYSVAPLATELYGIAPIVYNSHNAELTMAKQLYPTDEYTQGVVEKMERSVIEKSVAVTYCSTKDIEEMQEQYNVPALTKYIPNGTMMQDMTPASVRFKSKDIIFVGSGHPPNGVAARRVLNIAKMLPDYNFIICGNASGYLSGANIPANLSVRGLVAEEELHELFKNSFAFINPMDSGSGTHLKMMRALSYGIPIITSMVGARGFTDQEISDTMQIIDSDKDAVRAIEALSDFQGYSSMVENGFKLSKRYDWEVIKAEYAEFIQSVMSNNKPTTKAVSVSSGPKEKVMIYSIIRNAENTFPNFYKQLNNIVKDLPEYEFYLSIYENDSKDNTRELLYGSNWSKFAGVSITSEKLNTPAFGSVKDPVRVENLSNARNKAIEAGGFINLVDYVLMIDSDLRFDTDSVRRLLTFKEIEPDFDAVSAVSIRKNGTHYDWWATRTTPIYVETRSELDPDYNKKSHGEYYSTSNGLCVYRAKPFQDGVRHGWVNKATGEFDCEMVVLCQNFRDNGFKNIYINYKSFAYC
jgi:glycosyltransferase involved in cell wall biosynthesis